MDGRMGLSINCLPCGARAVRNLLCSFCSCWINGFPFAAQMLYTSSNLNEIELTEDDWQHIGDGKSGCTAPQASGFKRVASRHARDGFDPLSNMDEYIVGFTDPQLNEFEHIPVVLLTAIF